MSTDLLPVVQRLCPAGARVLDAGCGSGRLTLALADAGYVAVGLDRDLDAMRDVSEAHPKIPFFLDDLTDLDLPMALVGRGFDVVVAQGVLGTMGLAELDQALAGCARVAAPDGRLVADVPAGSIGTVTRTATKAGWDVVKREEHGDAIVVVARRRPQEAARPGAGSRLRSLLRR